VTAATATSLPQAAVEPIPFRRLLGVEFRKSYDTRSGFWLVVTIGILVLGSEIIATAVTAAQHADVEYGDFATIAGFTSSVLLPVLGILLVTAEWSQRSAMVTFSLEPRRELVIWAKVAVGGIWTLITVVVALAVGAICNVIYGLTPGNDAVWTRGSDMVHGIIAFAVVQELGMLTGFALAALCLSSPVAIVVFFLYSFLLPTLIGIGNALMDWFKDFSPWIDFNTAQQNLFDWDLGGKDWAQLLVSGFVWLVIPLALGLWRIFRAEVK
jgi:ABC-type transport system involved in multi-copper enzyme maturation permease subunit